MGVSATNNFNDALVLYILKRLLENKNQEEIGRTLMQKICYFAKVMGLPLSYDFQIHYYGPFSKELYHDLKEYRRENLIIDKSTDNSKSLYNLGENHKILFDKYKDELKNFEETIEKTVNKFKDYNIKDLELFSTIHYYHTVYSDFLGYTPDDEFVINKVYKVKEENFDKVEIKDKLNMLKELISLN